MRDRQTCVGCGKKSPETETNYTLISAQFGWRLTRYKDADGSLVVEWRCPTCWREYKRARATPPPSEPSLARSPSATPDPAATRPATPSARSGMAPRPPLPPVDARSSRPSAPAPPPWTPPASRTPPARAPSTPPPLPTATTRPGRPPR